MVSFGGLVTVAGFGVMLHTTYAVIKRTSL